MATIRAFLAIRPAETALHEVEALLPRLHRPCEEAGLAVRWVRPESLHVTLHFFGDLPEERIPAIEAAVADAAIGEAPGLLLGGLLLFPDPQRPRVIALGVTAPDGGPPAALCLAQGRIEATLLARGLLGAREGRPYRPHLTLGRVSDRGGRHDGERLGRLLARHGDGRFGPPESVREIILFESRQGRTGVEYVPRSRVGWRQRDP